MSWVTALLVALLLGLASERALGAPTRLDDDENRSFWKGWLLLDDPSLSPEDGGRKKGQITPKSVFIAPVIKDLPDCAPGYRADALGRCHRLVKIEQSAQLSFVLQKLNAMYSSDKFIKKSPQATTEGPLQVAIPLFASLQTPVSTTEAPAVTEEAEVVVVAAQVEVKDDENSTSIPGAIVTLWHLNSTNSSSEETTTSPPRDTTSTTDQFNQPTLTTDPDNQPTLTTDPDNQPSLTTDPGNQPTLTTDPDNQPTLTTDPDNQPTLTTDPDNQPTLTTDPDNQPTLTTDPDTTALTTDADISTPTTNQDIPTLSTDLDISTLTTDPEKPTQTTDPEKPTQTTEPEKPTQTTEPEKPTQTTEPEAGTQTTEPDESSESTESTTSSSHETTTEQPAVTASLLASPPTVLSVHRPDSSVLVVDSSEDVVQGQRLRWPQTQKLDTGWSWGPWPTTQRPLYLNFWSSLPQVETTARTRIRPHSRYPASFNGRPGPFFYRELSGQDVASVLRQPWRQPG